MHKKVNIEIEEKRIRPKLSEVNRLLCSNKKAKKILKWKPKFNGIKGLKYGLKKTIEWYSDSSNLKKYKSDIYNI